MKRLGLSATIPWSAASLPLALLVALMLETRVRAAESWTLERALEYALAHNPDTLLSRQRIAFAQAGLDQANSVFWPRLQVLSSYTRTDNPMQVFGSILNQRSYSTSLNFNDVPDVDALNARGLLTVPLYTAGRNFAAADESFAAFIAFAAFALAGFTVALADLGSHEPARRAGHRQCACAGQQAAQHLAAVRARAEEARHIVETRTVQNMPSRFLPNDPRILPSARWQADSFF